MPLPRRTTVRRLLIGLLLVAALASGWLWNARRLNELSLSEKQLVGAWEEVRTEYGRLGVVLLADHQVFSVFSMAGGWSCDPEPRANWHVARDQLVFRPTPKRGKKTVLEQWQDFFTSIWKTDDRIDYQLVWLTEDAIEWRTAQGENFRFHRCRDADLLREFDRLSSGTSH